MDFSHLMEHILLGTAMLIIFLLVIFQLGIYCDSQWFSFWCILEGNPLYFSVVKQTLLYCECLVNLKEHQKCGGNTPCKHCFRIICLCNWCFSYANDALMDRFVGSCMVEDICSASFCLHQRAASNSNARVAFAGMALTVFCWYVSLCRSRLILNLLDSRTLLYYFHTNKICYTKMFVIQKCSLYKNVCYTKIFVIQKCLSYKNVCYTKMFVTNLDKKLIKYLQKYS